MEQIQLKKLSNQLYDFIKSNEIKQLRYLINEYNEVDIADALMLMNEVDVIKIIRSLKSEKAAEIFTYLNNDYKEYIVKMFSSIEILDILKEIFVDDIVSLLDEMPANITTKILKSTTKEIRQEINKILKYEPDTAGSIMSVEYIELNDSFSLKESLDYIQKEFDDAEETSSYYIVDNKKRLLGKVSLQKIIFNDPKKNITQIMNKNINYVYTNSDQEEVAALFKKYDLQEIPVVNKQLLLVGIITIDDILDVIDEEVTEDIEKLAGILPTEKFYFDVSVVKMVRLRVFWLLFLMISATLSQSVITIFMHVYKVSDSSSSAQLDIITTIVTTMLVPVLPLISGTSGNAGSQSSIMIVRGLSLGTIKTADWYRIIYKELAIGSLVGLILIAANFLRMYIIDIINLHNWKLDKEHWFVIISLSLSLFVTIIISKVVGGLLPILARLVKIDPAVVAAPLLTTLVDALSTAIFFSISLIFFYSYIPTL